MNYEEALSFVFSIPCFGDKPTLNNINKLLGCFDNPQNSVKAVHIAGTNGKGSVAALTASVLRAAGFKTGLFTSPFIVDFRERIQINGEMIPKEKFARICTKVADKAKGECIKLTQFELITAVAFLYFRESRCDYTVLEAGLGGKYDATNTVAKPVCTVITKISLDHTEILGDTVEKIAAEKCGIIKPTVPLVTCSQQPSAMAVIKSTCLALSAPLTVADDCDITVNRLSLGGTELTYNNIPLKLALSGAHQAQNAAIAAEVLRLLGIDLRSEFVKNGFLSVVHPARLEVISENPKIVIDGAHNPDGTSALAEFLNEINWQGTLVFGAMRDKALGDMVKTLSTAVKRAVTVTVDNPRAESTEALAELFRACSVCAEPAESCEQALKKCGGDSVLVCGSLYLAAEVRKLFKK